MTHRQAINTGDSKPRMTVARCLFDQASTEPSSTSDVADSSFLSRRTLSSSGSSYPSLLSPGYKSIEDSWLLRNVPKQLDEEDTSLFSDMEEDKSSLFRGVVGEEKSSIFRGVFEDKSSLLSRGALEEKSALFKDLGDDEETSSIFGDVGEDESATNKSHASSFSFPPTSMWLGTCGISSDQVPPPKEVLLWLRAQVDLLMERRKRESKPKRHSRRKFQHEWGAKPSVDELSACSTSSTSSMESPSKLGASRHAFVDSGSTSWEATDNDESTLDSRFLPGPAMRNAAPHSHREHSRHLI